MMFTKLSVATVIIFFLFTVFTTTFAANLLPNDEVEGLRQIAKKLGKSNWNFDVDPCSRDSGWYSPSNNVVSCGECSSNGTVCHVVSIILKEQNLTGELPAEFERLPYLHQIDLTRNYISGTLPKQWASLKLVNVSLISNRLNGSIPEEFGNITTLESLELDENQLSGDIPQKLGDLPVIWRISLLSNRFTGELPNTLAKLKSLKQFHISDNHFRGNIPNFISNWTQLEKLSIQASGLDGPIPNFDLLSNLRDLRISDLNGTERKFPSLNSSSLKGFQTLILRGCNITGQLPQYLGEMKMDGTAMLDLSFNKLSGNIPNYTAANLGTADDVYFTGNLLSGPVPAWILNGSKNVDLSYNNLTLGSSEDENCNKQKLNLFGSSSKSNPSGMVSCLTNFSCPRYANAFYINCGGKEIPADGNIYEEDRPTSDGLPMFQKKTNWASSSTGTFLGEGGSYVWNTNNSFNRDRSGLLTTARLSPLSLTYYGFCLSNGKYEVKLHFAEIMFTDDQTYRSLGRRIFDVYIQGKQVLKDFNIVDDIQGINKESIKKFNVNVNNHTLEIRFYWAGRGTTKIPKKGVYGPLISAISVHRVNKGVSAGTVIGIVIGVASSIFLLLGILWWKGCLLLGILWWKGCLLRSYTMESDLKGLDLHTGSFTLKQLRAATSNFDVANKIGEGGFGPVYKGLLLDGTIIAVKQLSKKSKQGNREFVNEIGMISALQHPNLVKLYGCCIEGNELLLVYEYLENNSLARALFGPERYRLDLNWPTRYKICIGIARGMAYLHEESRLKIVHRDIKATNVLLDKDLNPKISDFGLAKLDEEDTTHISTRIAGTYGYMAPEYAMRGYLTDKADVYSFGIVALEIVSGRNNTISRAKQDPFYLLDWANDLKDEGKLMELVDESLGSKYNEEEAMVMINIGLLCTNATAAERPAMSSVVSILEGRSDIQQLVSVSVSDPAMKPSKHEKAQSISIEGDSWMASSTSGTDLYPVNPDTDYILKDDLGR